METGELQRLLCVALGCHNCYFKNENSVHIKISAKSLEKRNVFESKTKHHLISYELHLNQRSPFTRLNDYRAKRYEQRRQKKILLEHENHKTHMCVGYFAVQRQRRRMRSSVQSQLAFNTLALCCARKCRCFMPLFIYHITTKRFSLDNNTKKIPFEPVILLLRSLPSRCSFSYLPFAFCFCCLLLKCNEYLHDLFRDVTQSNLINHIYLHQASIMNLATKRMVNKKNEIVTYEDMSRTTQHYLCVCTL